MCSLSPGRKEEEREEEKEEEEEGLLGRRSHRRISQTPFPNFFSLLSLSFSLGATWSWSNSKKRVSGREVSGFGGDAGRICGLKPPYPRRNTETSGIVEIFG